MTQQKSAFPAGTIISEGTLYADPKQISKDGDRNVTVALKVKLNYREREGDELDAFFVDVLVTGTTAEHVLDAGWGKFDRIAFVGDFKGHRWERKLDGGGVNEEQTITIFARQIGASPRFVDVKIDKQDYNGEGGNSSSNDNDGASRRSRSNDDDAPAERSSRRSSRGGDDDSNNDSSERSSRRSSRGGDEESSSPAKSNDDDDAPERSSRRSSRRARDTSYED